MDRRTWTVGSGIWAQEVGEGPLVALVHGSMDRSGGMLRVRRLLQESYRVLRYDRRGYARSLGAGPPSSFDEQVDDLAGLLAGRPAVVVGHSFGGIVCLALAERRPELVRAVLAYEAPKLWAPWWPGSSAGRGALAVARAGAGATEPVASGDTPGDAGARAVSNQSELGAEAAEWFLRRMIGDAMWERLPATMRAERRAEGPTLVAEMASVRPPAPPPFDAAAIPVPVVAVHGSEARPHHVRATGELARSAPRAELQVIAGADHGAHLSHPVELADLVRRAAALADGRS
ncbi:MAG TPA: alpha/beta hydrolase [Acidimicrobiales bacterium]|nr:alpha/beta hydrolase [Acidimicrobiales bacterium]